MLLRLLMLSRCGRACSSKANSSVRITAAHGGQRKPDVHHNASVPSMVALAPWKTYGIMAIAGKHHDSPRETVTGVEMQPPECSCAPALARPRGSTLAGPRASRCAPAPPARPPDPRGQCGSDGMPTHALCTAHHADSRSL